MKEIVFLFQKEKRKSKDNVRKTENERRMESKERKKGTKRKTIRDYGKIEILYLS